MTEVGDSFRYSTSPQRDLTVQSLIPTFRRVCKILLPPRLISKLANWRGVLSTVLDSHPAASSTVLIKVRRVQEATASLVL